ncbi:hypothetical protein BV898_04375 [Hypsibius exemplaris]|uniref:Uncharacterized protein n=1 Tax=Hypsibius exemplaris TaxID=2072580 RepID=A0A1W0X331_HYPEX|nr:hypothetical protein BV898_04375 [Hypsibius exemplaris]
MTESPRQSHPLEQQTGNPPPPPLLASGEIAKEDESEPSSTETVTTKGTFQFSLTSSTVSRPRRHSSYLSSTYCGRSQSSSQVSPASSALLSFTSDATFRDSNGGGTDVPVAVGQMHHAIKDFVAELMPKDTELFALMQQYLPAFSQKYGVKLMSKLTCDLGEITKIIQENLIGQEETRRLEQAVTQLSAVSRTPDGLAKLTEATMKTPEGRLLEPKHRVAKTVRKAARYGDRAMSVLKSEEAELEAAIFERTRMLQRLVALSAEEVATVEEVASPLQSVKDNSNGAGSRTPKGMLAETLGREETGTVAAKRSLYKTTQKH